MKTQADKTQENESLSVANGVSQKQSSSESTFQFVDKRPEAVAQRKLQEMVNNSPKTEQAAQLQAMADNFSVQQQLSIQKKENHTGLPDNLKIGMENLSGMSLDDVKVHRNSDKPAQLQAHAYAQGIDIHLGPGQEKHLPHEAWHVVQQKQGKVKPIMQMKAGVNINDDESLENEADLLGFKAKQFVDSRHETFAQLKLNGLMNKRVVQMTLKDATSKYKITGGLKEDERTLADFLAGNDIKNRFYPDDRIELDVEFDQVLAAHNTHRKGKAGGQQSGNALKIKYDALLLKAQTRSVMVDTDNWNELIALGLDDIVGTSSIPPYYIKADAEKAAVNVWPTNLGDVPQDFWKALLTEAKKRNAPTPQPKVLSITVKQVLDHANTRFNAWRSGQETNRGAWAGSDAHGAEPDDYKTVGVQTMTLLKAELPTDGWKYKDNSLSAAHGFSLHKGNFIYHL